MPTLLSTLLLGLALLFLSPIVSRGAVVVPRNDMIDTSASILGTRNYVSLEARSRETTPLPEDEGDSSSSVMSAGNPCEFKMGLFCTVKRKHIYMYKGGGECGEALDPKDPTLTQIILLQGDIKTQYGRDMYLVGLPLDQKEYDSERHAGVKGDTFGFPRMQIVTAHIYAFTPGEAGEMMEPKKLSNLMTALDKAIKKLEKKRSNHGPGFFKRLTAACRLATKAKSHGDYISLPDQ